MSTSSYFERAIFYNSSAAIDDYFKSRVSQLFELSEDRSSIEFHVQRPFRQVDNEILKAFDVILSAPKLDTEVETSDSILEPPSPTDDLVRSEEVPRYTSRKISDVKNLTAIAAVSFTFGTACYSSITQVSIAGVKRIFPNMVATSHT